MPAAGDTLYLPFQTAVNGVPTVWTGSPAVEVYKNGSIVQSTAGVTITASVDGVVGQNLVTIDTTADATFYANGGQFRVVVSAGTVGGVSIVGALASEFSLLLGFQAACAAALAAFFTSAAQLAGDVWTSATRLLTAGTNIVLAKGVGVTGFNDLSAAQVQSAADAAITASTAIDALPTAAELTTALSTSDDAMLAALAAFPLKRNAAGQHVNFYMRDSTDPKIGKTGVCTVTRSIDGGAFGATTGTVSELGSGVCDFAPSAADVNGTLVVFMATLSGGVTVVKEFFTHV